MGDTKEGRENQARAEERRQRERALREELDRWHETEPPRALANELDELDYPATTDAVVAAVGDHEVAVADEQIPVAEVVERSGRDRFDSAADARQQIGRPTVAAALRRIRAASDEAGRRAQFRAKEEAFERTLQSLESLSEDDEDEGIAVVTAWILDSLDANGKLPESRRVRKQAVAFCRANGYEVRNDSWLGA
ncbi:DUF5789 family protein [Halobacterium litoreum]|uniref:Uncharacterized protein n=1 Tax=Halobacterium litoreum TaxID=2039234 RepID=A0ABD5NHH2_9EURY|nr:hypothetical protein [Halobacterium litoreum]UHH12643.1 hypothetical protein LT972_10795 [Halobacterium litoreum]